MSNFIGLKGKKILIVEDVEMNQYLARHIIESWGCVVEVVENGSLAVERARAKDYDLVLMDIQMPVMDGMEATKQIRKLEDEFKATVPIVALTANAQKGECDTYIKIGMNDWLAKPFEEPSLYRTVSKNVRTAPVKAVGPEAVKAIKEDIPTVKTEKSYDLAMIEAISGGDRTFIDKMLKLFLDTVPATLSDLQNSASSGDWQALSKHAHKLKSTIDSMGIYSLKQDIRDIETQSKHGGDAAQLHALVDKVAKVIGIVMEEVREKLKGKS